MILREGNNVEQTKDGYIKVTMVSYDGKKFRPYGEVLSIRHHNVVSGKVRKRPIQAAAAAKA